MTARRPPAVARPHARVEVLEPRALLSGSGAIMLTGAGALVVRGDRGGPNTITVAAVPAGAPAGTPQTVQVTRNGAVLGVRTTTLPDGDGETSVVNAAPADVRKIRITGGYRADVLTVAGLPAPAELRGDNGNDVLTGGDGPDLILGGPGRDLLAGGGGGDRLIGQAGDDLLAGGGGADSLDGGAGNDTLNGGAEPDTLLGRTGGDAIVGDDGEDSARGGQGDDTIDGNGGADVLIGDRGDDVIRGGPGGDQLIGSNGGDTMDGGEAPPRVRPTTEAPNPVQPDPDIDRLIGGRDHDVLIKRPEDLLIDARGTEPRPPEPPPSPPGTAG